MAALRIATAVAAGALALALAAGQAHGQGPSATLTLQQVFGSPAASLTVAFGAIDATCTLPPVAGVVCGPDAVGVGATWYGTIEFRVRLTGLGLMTTRLVGTRQAGGSMPAGRLVDGPSGTKPATPYPTAPAAGIVLRTAIGTGPNTAVTRSLGVRVVAADAAGAWSTATVYSLIVE